MSQTAAQLIARRFHCEPIDQMIFGARAACQWSRERETSDRAAPCYKLERGQLLPRMEVPAMSKLKLVKGASKRGTLVYGMRMFELGEPGAVEDAQVHLASGLVQRVTMHSIEGTRNEIRRQLLHSIDAFFELLDEPTPR
jgi:hypothetical protein